MRGLHWLLVLLLALAGCARAPDEQALRLEVARRLAAALPADAVEVAAIARRGSQRDADAPAGSVRRIVYYDLELRVLRDYDFGGWDAPGVPGLVSALGAGPRGVRGVAAGGNRAGDTVEVHGSLLFERQGEQWVAVAPSGYGPVAAPSYVQPGSGSAAERWMAALREMVAHAPPEASQPLREALAQELEQAYAAINARLARFERGYAIAAGPDGGQYLRLVQAFAQVPGSRIVPLVTGGGEENLRLLREGRVDMALSQGDAAQAAYRGEGSFSGAGPYPELRAVGSLYPEALHVLVRADSGASTLAGLRGKPVAVGGPGSAARATALSVLAAHGLASPAVDLRDMPLGAALVALRQREIEAVVTVIGIPADLVRVAATSLPLRVLDLDAAAVGKLVAENPAYLPFAIPAGTYPGMGGAVRSIATPAMLLARNDLSDAEIVAVTQSVFGTGHDLAALGSVQGAQISAASAARALPVPQHLAAARALAEMAAVRRDGAVR